MQRKNDRRSEQHKLVNWLEAIFLKLDLSFISSKTIADGNKGKQSHPSVSTRRIPTQEEEGMKPLSLFCNLMSLGLT